MWAATLVRAPSLRAASSAGAAAAIRSAWRDNSSDAQSRRGPLFGNSGYHTPKLKKCPHCRSSGEHGKRTDAQKGEKEAPAEANGHWRPPRSQGCRRAS
jgi:hypothetical protein